MLRRREPYNKLPEYLNEDMLAVVAMASDIEFKSTRDMQIFRDWLNHHLEEAQREQAEALMLRDRRRSESRKQERASADQLAYEWIKDHGEEGMMIKVTGARDGLGYREIISFRENARDPKRSTMTCYQLDSDGNRMQIVEIMWNKFRGLLEFGEMPERRPGQTTPRRYAPRSNPRRPVTITTLRELQVPEG